MADPDAERFHHVEQVAQPPLQHRIHARHEQRIGAHSGSHGEESRSAASPSVVAVIDAPHRHLHPARTQNSAAIAFCRRASPNPGRRPAHSRCPSAIRRAPPPFPPAAAAPRARCHRRRTPARCRNPRATASARQHARRCPDRRSAVLHLRHPRVRIASFATRTTALRRGDVDPDAGFSISATRRKGLPISPLFQIARPESPRAYRSSMRQRPRALRLNFTCRSAVASLQSSAGNPERTAEPPNP